jgi:hypothetical protein
MLFFVSVRRLGLASADEPKEPAFGTINHKKDDG